MIAFVGFLETIAARGGRWPTLANAKRYGYDANQELLALGAASVMAPLPHHRVLFPKGGELNVRGHPSDCWGLDFCGCPSLRCKFIMPVLEVLPFSTLAPLIIHVAIGVTDIKSFPVTMRA